MIFQNIYLYEYDLQSNKCSKKICFATITSKNYSYNYFFNINKIIFDCELVANKFGSKHNIIANYQYLHMTYNL